MKLTYGPVTERTLPHRHDPDYDAARPLEWRELADPRLWVGAVLCLFGLVAMLALIFTTVPGPK